MGSEDICFLVYFAVTLGWVGFEAYLSTYTVTLGTYFSYGFLGIVSIVCAFNHFWFHGNDVVMLAVMGASALLQCLWIELSIHTCRRGIRVLILLVQITILVMYVKLTGAGQ